MKKKILVVIDGRWVSGTVTQELHRSLTHMGFISIIIRVKEAAKPVDVLQLDKLEEWEIQEILKRLTEIKEEYEHDPVPSVQG